MPERSNGTVSKTVVPFRVPRVRIPVFPQKQKELPRVAPFCFYDRQRGTRGFVTAKRLRRGADKEWGEQIVWDRV